jgi:hypothetical protein
MKRVGKAHHSELFARLLCESRSDPEILGQGLRCRGEDDSSPRTRDGVAYPSGASPVYIWRASLQPNLAAAIREPGSHSCFQPQESSVA